MMSVQSHNVWKRIELTLFIALILLGTTAILATAMSPDWKVQTYGEHLRVSSPDTAIAANGIETAAEGTYKVKTTNITMTVSGGKKVNAIVREPVGAPSGRPACVFIHGAGTGKASEVYEDLASAMASAGITTLVQDKRLDNYTWLSRDYLSSAVDYETGLDTLRHWDGVDASKAGLYAESEGTWIATVVARQDKDVAFAVLTSPPVVGARSQMAMAATAYLNIIGAPEGVESIVPKVISMDFGWVGLNYADFDASKYLSSLTMPLLVNYGTLDPAMPVEQGAKMLIEDAAAVGNDNVTVRYYPTNHQMRTGSALSLPGLPLEEHYTVNLEDWVNAVAAGADADDWSTPMIAGEQPFQEYAAPTDITPGLVTNLNVIIVVAVLAVLFWLIAAVGSVALVAVNFTRSRRIRRAQREAAAGRWDAARGPISRLPKPRRFTGGTGALIAVNLLVSLALTAASVGYVAVTASSAMALKDSGTFLHAGWLLLQIGLIIGIVLFAWMWTRILVNKTRFRFRDEPEHEPMRMLPGHWVVIVATTLSILCLLFLAAWLGLASY